MKIAVCIKHVPVSDEVEVDKDTHRLIRENMESDINPCDLNAMEYAVRIKNENGAQIDVYTMGVPDAAKSLKKCLAMGADNAYLVTDRAFAGGDSLGTAKVLAEAIRYNEVDSKYDMIFTGSESTDGATGQVGPMIAELLEIDNVAETVDINAKIFTDASTNRKVVRVKKKISSGKAVLDVALPCLFTIPFGCNSVSLPTLRSQMKANKKEIKILSQDILKIDDNIGMKGAISIVTDIVPNKTSKETIFIQEKGKALKKKLLELLKESDEEEK